MHTVTPACVMQIATCEIGIRTQYETKLFQSYLFHPAETRREYRPQAMYVIERKNNNKQII